MIKPYLNFNGNCEKAFNLYREAFGGEITYLERYGEAEPNPGFPIEDDVKNLVRHAELILTNTEVIAGGDATWPFDKGSAVSIIVQVFSDKYAQKAWSVLSREGLIIDDLVGKNQGTLKDKYGFTWIIKISAEKAKY